MKTEEQRLLEELYHREERSDWKYSDTKIKKVKNVEDFPDAKKHQIISFIKSGIRIAACFVGGIGYYTVGFFLLGVAEIVGIIEELV